ncbi:MAG: hypothetical protein CMJ58_02125 [Planctomycetaceae bacterium]|nr:hypothetical protein [Planctomycetaceae bacterium]
MASGRFVQVQSPSADAALHYQRGGSRVRHRIVAFHSTAAAMQWLKAGWRTSSPFGGSDSDEIRNASYRRLLEQSIA